MSLDTILNYFVSFLSCLLEGIFYPIYIIAIGIFNIISLFFNVIISIISAIITIIADVLYVVTSLFTVFPSPISEILVLAATFILFRSLYYLVRRYLI